jgi:hypothetical protein
MLFRFNLSIRQMAAWLRLILLALLTLLTGCDRKPTWRGVATDRPHDDPSQDQGMPRDITNVDP